MPSLPASLLLICAALHLSIAGSKFLSLRFHSILHSLSLHRSVLSLSPSLVLFFSVRPCVANYAIISFEHV